MLITRIKNIEIQYDDGQTLQIDFIKKIIKNNYNLFLNVLNKKEIISFLPNDDENIFYISNFDVFFNDIAKQTYCDKNIKKLFGDFYMLPVLYYEHLVREANKNGESQVEPNQMINDEMLYSIIGYYYFKENGTFEKFIDYLKFREDNDIVIEWLREKTRFDTYNFLIDVTIKILNKDDYSFVENIPKILNKMLEQSVHNIIDFIDKKENLPQITKEEFDTLFYEFLQSINAPKSWYKMYEELKLENKLIFEEKAENIDDSKCYVDNGILKILVSSDGSIKDFCSFVHEFSHYVSRYETKISFSSFSISELCSIFFERLSAIFIKNKGYNNSIIDKVINERKQSNLNHYLGLSPIFGDINRYIAQGHIYKEDKIKLYQNRLIAYKQVMENVTKICAETGSKISNLQYLDTEIDIQKEVDKECDELIDYYVKYGLSLINGYQCILDTFLADELLQRTITDPTIIPKMIETTNRLNNMKLSDILTIFDLQNIFTQPETLNKSI